MPKAVLEKEVQTDVWDKQEFLVFAEGEREKRRKQWGILTFDCYNAKCYGDRVKCSVGHKLAYGKDGTMPLVSVLKGTTSLLCRSCFDFSGGE